MGLRFLDIETTGLKFGYHEIISVAVYDHTTSLTIRSFLANHPDRLSPGAKAVNGYDHKKRIGKVVPLKGQDLVDIHRCLGSHTVVGKNVWFDLSFLQTASDLLGGEGSLRFPHRVLDLTSIMLWEEPGLESYSSKAMTEFYKVAPEPAKHTAHGGARWARNVYNAMEAKYKLKCKHAETTFIKPPPGTEEEDFEKGIDRNMVYELCSLCGRSRSHWEQGGSAWLDVPDVKEWPIDD